ncbi:hypothetical protein AABB24_021827, partial [Solanum stoloniferum]
QFLSLLSHFLSSELALTLSSRFRPAPPQQPRPAPRHQRSSGSSRAADRSRSAAAARTSSRSTRRRRLHPDLLPFSFNSRSIFLDIFRRALVMATVRNLKIKTSTCKRILKELHSYDKEVEREAGKTADMKEKGADPYDLKQQENVLAESRMMVPDCRKRLEGALEDLKGTLVELEETDEKQGPEFEEARNIIADVEKLFESSEL